MKGIGQRRRVLAILAMLAWLLGVEALPAAHLAHHEADHSHDVTGAIVHHVDHDHVAPPAEHHTDLAQLAIDHPIEPGHQAGGVAHHAVALYQAEPPQLPIVELAVSHDELALPTILTTTRAVATSARAPPHRTTT